MIQSVITPNGDKRHLVNPDDPNADVYEVVTYCGRTYDTELDLEEHVLYMAVGDSCRNCVNRYKELRD